MESGAGGDISWVFKVHWAKGQRHEDAVIGKFEEWQVVQFSCIRG